MKVQYGNIPALCNRCASQHFELIAPDEPLTAASVLACLRCGGKVIHGHLISQIGDEAVRQANIARNQHNESRRRIALRSTSTQPSE
jgi:hypothetical protein